MILMCKFSKYVVSLRDTIEVNYSPVMRGLRLYNKIKPLNQPLKIKVTFFRIAYL